MATLTYTVYLQRPVVREVDPPHANSLTQWSPKSEAPELEILELQHISESYPYESQGHLHSQTCRGSTDYHQAAVKAAMQGSSDPSDPDSPDPLGHGGGALPPPSPHPPHP